jgi:hypothetical protein
VKDFLRGSLEVLGRLHDLDAARAAYAACRQKYPTKAAHAVPRQADFAPERSGLRCDF